MQLFLFFVLFSSVVNTTFGAIQNIPWDRIKNFETKWPSNHIPFRISPAFTENEVRIIRSAMDEITTSVSCIKWIDRTDEAQFMDITTGRRGSFSTLGYSVEKEAHVIHIQKMDLQSGYMRKGVILSLMMRSLGFGEENNRPDRDKYLTVVWVNVQDKEKYRFIRFRDVDEKLTLVNVCNDGPILSYGQCVKWKKMDTLDLEYDYGSITHFGPFFYTKDRLPTLEIKGNISEGVKVGQRVALSPLDIQKLTTVYCSNAPAPECKDTSGLCVVLKLGCWFNYIKRTCPRSCNACGIIPRDATSSLKAEK